MAAQRRHKQHRRRGGRFRGLYRLLSVILIVAAIVVACTVFFRVNEVTVSGNDRYTADEITQVSGISIGDSLVFIDRNRVTKKILTNLPYVESVSLRRALPDGVLITVKECVAVAAVSDGSSWWLLDGNTKILEQADEATAKKYMVITGLTPVMPTAGELLKVDEESAVTLGRVKSLLQAMDQRGVGGKGTSLDCTDSTCYVMGFDGRFTVRMPATADFSKLIYSLQKCIADLEDGETGTFDFTISDKKVYFSHDS